MTDPLEERVARAIHREQSPVAFDLLAGQAQNALRREARAAIAAIREAEAAPERVEAVARVICDAFDGHDERPDDFDRNLAREIVAAIHETELCHTSKPSEGVQMLAEPLTSTPVPSTTETDGEAVISQDPPQGFEWEYRAVIEHGDGTRSEGGWRGEVSSPRTFAQRVNSVNGNAYVQRRPVGKPERMGD